VTWYAASIEKWLNTNIDGLVIDSYDVTIYPAETSNNSVTLKAKTVDDLENDDPYRASFLDLNGGKTEYIITIVCVIGKSRMKGIRIVTTLLPYGPEKPRSGMIKDVSTNEIEVIWEPPKGEFTKYVIMIDPNILNVQKPFKKKISSLSQIQTSTMHSSSVERCETIDDYDLSDESWERELSSKLTNFTIVGVNPGEAYLIKLITKTGERCTQKPIFEIVMTKPEPVMNLSVENVTMSSLDLKWIAPEKHPHLKAYNLSLLSRDGTYKKEMTVKHAGATLNKFTLDVLKAETEYVVSISTVCVFDNLKTVSKWEKVNVITRPEPPNCLILEGRFCNSLTVSWKPPLMLLSSFHKYKLCIYSPEIHYYSVYELPGDKDTYTFTKLPDQIGSGTIYK